MALGYLQCSPYGIFFPQIPAFAPFYGKVIKQTSNPPPFTAKPRLGPNLDTHWDGWAQRSFPTTLATSEPKQLIIAPILHLGLFFMLSKPSYGLGCYLG